MTVLAHRIVTEEEYQRAEARYFREETLEDMSESEESFVQREITLAALNHLKACFPDISIFNELLVLYPLAEGIGRVVPDNFIARHVPQAAWKSSFRVTSTNRPFWVVEYVSPSTPNKDYVESFEKYEDLQIPYCTMFEHPVQKLTMFHSVGNRYEPMRADSLNRYSIPELDLQVGIMDGWMRFWFRGELLPTLFEGTVQLRAASQKLVEMDQLLSEAHERDLRRVIKLATAAGRMDIVKQAPQAEPGQIQQWLDLLLG